jgi:hypothetical protein
LITRGGVESSTGVSKIRPRIAIASSFIREQIDESNRDDIDGVVAAKVAESFLSVALALISGVRKELGRQGKRLLSAPNIRRGYRLHRTGKQ